MEEHLWTLESFSANGNQLPIMMRCYSIGDFLLKIQGNIAQLSPGVTHDLILCSDREAIA